MKKEKIAGGHGVNRTGVGRGNRLSRDWGGLSDDDRRKIIPTTDGEAYELVLSFFYVNGARHGAKAALGKRLDCTRAAVDMWEKNGLPLGYIRELKRLTGLRGSQIYPVFAKFMD